MHYYKWNLIYLHQIVTDKQLYNTQLGQKTLKLLSYFQVMLIDILMFYICFNYFLTTNIYDSYDRRIQKDIPKNNTQCFINLYFYFKLIS
jgi:hypothetical protein